jgi:BASS family bile acid:Na+ symporter
LLFLLVAYFKPDLFIDLKPAIVPLLGKGNIATMGIAVVLAVMLHNLLGLAIGYWMPRGLGWEKRLCRTLAIEVGIQNSGLCVTLAVKYFSAVAALPGTIFSIWHNLSGSILAGGWSRRPAGSTEPKTEP